MSQGQSEKGQIVVEYVLILIVAVTVALMISSGLVSRNSDSPGVLTEKWRSLIEFIAADVPEQGG